MRKTFGAETTPLPGGKNYEDLAKAAEVARLSLACHDLWIKYEDDKTKYSQQDLRGDLIKEMKHARKELSKTQEQQFIPAPLFKEHMGVFWNTK